MSARSCRLENLTKCDDTICVDIRILQDSLRTEIKLIPEIPCAQNASFQCNSAHANFPHLVLIKGEGCMGQGIQAYP